MPRYTGIVSVRGPIRTASVSRLHFVVGESKVAVLAANLLAYENGGWFDKGIRLTLSAYADSLEFAVHYFATTTDLIVPLLAVSAAAEAPHVRLELAYTDDSEATHGEFLRRIDTPLPELKLRKVYLDHLEPLFVRLAAGGQRLRDRTARTLWWYHRALEEVDPVNRFSLLWTALESLNPLLTDHWNLKPNRRSCPKCQADLGNLPGVYGLDKLFREIPEAVDDLFRRARDLRNAIVHGTRQPAELRGEAVALLGAVEAAVPRGIARLLSLPQRTEDSLARPVLQPLPSVTASARVAFTRVGEGDIGLHGFYPHLDLTIHTSVNFDEHAEPKEFDFTGDVTLWCSQAIAPEKLSLTAHLRGRDVGIRPGELLQKFVAPAQPPNRGHGVTLWQVPRDFDWTPRADSARA